MNKLSTVVFWLIVLLFVSLAFLSTTQADTLERDITPEEEAQCEYIAEIVRKVQSNRSTPVWDFWYKHSTEFDNDIKAWYISRYVYREVPENVHPMQAKVMFRIHCQKTVHDSKPELRYQL